MRYLSILLSAAVLFVFTSCDKEKEIEEPKTATEQVPTGVHAVEAIEAVNASNYTYINVSENGRTYWIAVPQMEVKAGEKFFFSKSMEMKKFKSETLDRTFESILFVEDISKEMPQQTGMQHPVPTTKEEKVNVQKLKDGKSIGEIYSELSGLNGQNIKVRGKVMKFNPGIMGTNWIHIQDGTSSQGEYDLVVTSDAQVQLGQVITAEGKLVTNKDFGSGYTYKVLIEKAKIYIE